jgi:UDP-N-acetylmuramoylalanine--D-glutamate ligase
MVLTAMQLIVSDRKHIVVGLGMTGVSCVRYLLAQGSQVEVVDTRLQPPGLEKFKAEFPQVPVRLGPLDAEYLSSAADLVLSPGVALAEPAIQEAIKAGVDVTSDVDMFSCVSDAPIIAITGSNGKSTVTALLGEMAKDAGTKVAVGGNIGKPVLDLLDQSIELYVIELSSFQLETTRRLGAMAATVLNVSPDHMDRYENLQGYHQAKHRIFRGAQIAVVNDDEPLSQPLMTQTLETVHFGLDRPGLKKFSTVTDAGETFLTFGFERLINVAEMKLKGRHNWSNALAAMAFGHTAGIPVASMLETLKSFPGLPHRCQLVREIGQVNYINDSKGTNVGATATALESFGRAGLGEIVLIAGGIGKDADFTPLSPLLKSYARAVVLIGRDAALIEKVVPEGVTVQHAIDMNEAVCLAKKFAKSGDTVLLSPACASMDMFDNFEHRGQVFEAVVNSL